ncbi:Kinesin-like protein kif3b [Terramyces sp. JEL0728]|nr:Kinesin-like protein kif3b [Terramyces sp. JEL0728]
MTAQEWETQNTIVKSYSLPITSIINSYQQDYPSSFVDLQQKYWKPLIDHLEQSHNLKINTTNGILRIKQNEETVDKFREIISGYSDLQLAVFEKAVTRTKSFIIGLCLLDKQVDADFGYKAGSLETIHQIEKWGEVEDSHDTDREEMKRCLAAFAEDGTNFSQFAAEFNSKLPFKNVLFNSAKGQKQVTLDLELKKFTVDMFPKFVPGALEYNCIFFHLFIVSVEDLELYKNTTRKQIQEWVNIVANKKNQDWAIISLSDESVKTRLFKSTTVSEKLKADFNLRKSNHFHIKLNNSDWTELLNTIKESILTNISHQINQYEEDSRRLEQQRMIPGWNYCQFFIMKDALVYYDELEASFFQTLEEQGAPWFKKFGGSETGDENPEFFNLKKKKYRDMIIQNSISIFDFRMYMFSCQIVLLNKSQLPIEIVQRTKQFTASFSKALREYQQSLPNFFSETWTYSVITSILSHCDELLAICNYNSEQIVLYEGYKGELLHTCRYQLDRLGVASGFLHTSIHCEKQENTDENMLDSDITSPDKCNIEIINSQLKTVLSTKNTFDQEYQQLTVKCLRSFERCGRPNIEKYLKVDLALLYFTRQNFTKASEILSELCFKFPHWTLIDTFLIERYIICQKQLKKNSNLLQCYLHLLQHPQVLQLENSMFYMKELINCFKDLTEITSVEKSRLFAISHIRVHDTLNDEKLSCSFNLVSYLPVAVDLEYVNIQFVGGDGLEFNLQDTNIKLKTGTNTIKVQLDGITIPGLYSPTTVKWKYEKLLFHYDIPTKTQTFSQVRIYEQPNMLSLNAELSPDIEDSSIEFTISTNECRLFNADFEIEQLTSLFFELPAAVKCMTNDKEMELNVKNGAIILPKSPENTVFKFTLKYKRQDLAEYDHKLKLLLRDFPTSKKRVYSNVVNFKLYQPFSISNTITHDAKSSLIQYQIEGKEVVPIRIVEYDLEPKNDSRIIVPEANCLLFNNDLVTVAIKYSPKSFKDSVVSSITVTYHSIFSEVQDYIFAKLKKYLERANVHKAFGRICKLYSKYVLSNVNPMDLCLYGKIKCKPLEKQLLHSHFKDIPETQVSSVYESVEKLNNEISVILEGDLVDVVTQNKKITLYRTVYPCDILITTQWQIESKPEIFVCDTVALTLVIKPVIWNQEPIWIEMNIPAENSLYFIGGLTKHKFQLAKQISIPLTLCPIKPGPLFLPIPEFKNEKGNGVFFEKVNYQSDQIVLPREESCRRSCNVSNYMLRQSPFDPSDWFCQSCQCMLGLVDSARRNTDIKRKINDDGIPGKKKARPSKKKKKSRAKDVSQVIDEVAIETQTVIVEVPCKGTQFDEENTLNSNGNIPVPTQIVPTAPTILYKIKDTRRNNQIKPNMANEDLFLSRRAKAKLLELEKDIQDIKFPVGAEVLVADGGNALWPAKVVQVQSAKRLISYHGWESVHDEWIDSDSKRLFECDIAPPIPDQQFVKVKTEITQKKLARPESIAKISPTTSEHLQEMACSSENAFMSTGSFNTRRTLQFLGESNAVEVSSHGFVLGNIVEIKDRTRNWNPAKMVEFHKGKIKFSYFGWSSKYDEWIDSDSRRIRKADHLKPENLPTTIIESETEVEDELTTIPQAHITVVARTQAEQETSESKHSTNLEYIDTANSHSQEINSEDDSSWKIFCNECQVRIKTYRMYCMKCEIPSDGWDYQSFDLCVWCFETKFPKHKHKQEDFAKENLVEKQAKIVKATLEVAATVDNLDQWQINCNQCEKTIKSMRIYCSKCEIPSEGYDYQSFELCVDCYYKKFPIHDHPPSDFVEETLETVNGKGRKRKNAISIKYTTDKSLIKIKDMLKGKKESSDSTLNAFSDIHNTRTAHKILNEKTVTTQGFSVGQEVLVADGGNALWPGVVKEAKGSKRLISYHGWSAAHDEWIDSTSKRLFASSEQFAIPQITEESVAIIARSMKPIVEKVEPEEKVEPVAVASIVEPAKQVIKLPFKQFVSTGSFNTRRTLQLLNQEITLPQSNDTLTTAETVNIHGFVPNKIVEIKDKEGKWWPARMVGLFEGSIRFRFLGWSAKYDEMIDSDSRRIRECVTMPSEELVNEIVDETESEEECKPVIRKNRKSKVYDSDDESWKIYCNRCTKRIRNVRVYCTYCEVPADDWGYESFDICLVCFEYNFPFHVHPRTSFAREILFNPSNELDFVKDVIDEECILQVVKGDVAAKECMFCHLPENEENSFVSDKPFLISIGTKSKHYSQLWAHEKCARYAPEVFVDKGNWYNVGRAVRRSRGLKCIKCEKPGATIGCFKSKCFRNYHLECTDKDLSFFDRGILFWCPKHEGILNRMDDFDDSFLCDSCNMSLKNESWYTCESCSKDYFSTFDICTYCFDNRFPNTHPHQKEAFITTDIKNRNDIRNREKEKYARKKKDATAKILQQFRKNVNATTTTKKMEKRINKCAFCRFSKATEWRQWNNGLLICEGCYQLTPNSLNLSVSCSSNQPIRSITNQDSTPAVVYACDFENYKHEYYSTRRVTNNEPEPLVETVVPPTYYSNYKPADDHLFSMIMDSTFYDIPSRAPRWARTWLPQLVNSTLKKYTVEGERVLSNFIGRGTDAIESLLLKRRLCGVDVNPLAITLAQRNSSFAIPKTMNISAVYRPIIVLGDARNLSGPLFEDELYSHILSHPPYKDCIQYSSQLENDLSRIPELDDFLDEMLKVVKESYRLLKFNRRLTLGIGDNRKGCYLIPVSFKLFELYLKEGFELEELIIKKQRHCQGAELGKYLSVQYDFLVMEHEYIAIFRKNGTRLDYSPVHWEGDCRIEFTEEICEMDSDPEFVNTSSVWEVESCDPDCIVKDIANRFGDIEYSQVRIRSSKFFSRVRKNKYDPANFHNSEEIQIDDVPVNLYILPHIEVSNIEIKSENWVNDYRKLVLSIAKRAAERLESDGLFIFGVKDYRIPYSKECALPDLNEYDALCRTLEDLAFKDSKPQLSVRHTKFVPLTMLVFEDLSKHMENEFRLKDFFVVVPTGYSCDATAPVEQLKVCLETERGRWAEELKAEQLGQDGEKENVIVVGRCRPFSEKEKLAGHTKVAEMNKKNGSIMLSNPKNTLDVKTFSFDAVFDEDSTQSEVYNSTARTIVEAALGGFNGTVFVYGQTGTGKTYSMQGVHSIPHLRGIIPQCFHHIFDFISRTGHKKFLVRVSFLEIYNEEVKDLLIKQNKNPKGGLDLKENPDTGVFVKDLTAVVVKSVEELEALMELGNKNRSVGATLMNENSSRSHSIFTITIESSEVGPDGQDKYVSGKLNLVDLAGSERQSKTGASGDRLKEATKINLSLSALGNCISALVDGKSFHIPYRDSKLTRLLQDSLGGNAKTLMIATLSPASYNFEETLSTLRYANRAKNIKNKPVVNEDPKDAMLREYQNEIERLRLALEARQKGTGQAKVVTKIVKKTVVRKRQGKKAQQEADALSSEEEDIDDESVNREIKDTTESMVNPLAVLDPDTIAKLQEEVDAEKKALLASKDMVVEERQRIAAELEKRAADLEQERQEREALAIKLQAMEGKLLIGGVNIEEKINEQERIIQETEAQLQEEQRRKRLLEKRIEAKQEVQLQLEENFSSLQEEVEVKTKKLKKLWGKLQEVKEEINDIKDEFRIEKEDLLDTIRELSRELELKITITENFIPEEEQRKMEKQTVYNEEKDDWALRKIINRGRERKLERPHSISTVKRPVCQYVKLVLGMGDLELPERTTLQNEAPRKGGHQISPLQGALDYALSQDNDEVFVSSDLMGESIYDLSNEKRSKSRGLNEGYPSAKGQRPKRQLAIDLLIHNFGFTRVGVFNSPFVEPIVGSRVYSGEDDQIYTSFELYHSDQCEFLIAQLRSPVTAGFGIQFAKALAEWVQQNEIKVFIITGFDKKRRDDVQLRSNQLYYHSSEIKLSEFGINEIEKELEDSEYPSRLPFGAGVSRFIVHELNHKGYTVLGYFTEEGDNLNPSVELVDVVCKAFKLQFPKKLNYPSSWDNLYGPQIDFKELF